MVAKKINEKRLLIGPVICYARIGIDLVSIELIWEKKTMGVAEEVYNNCMAQATADTRLNTNEIFFSFRDRTFILYDVDRYTILYYIRTILYPKTCVPTFRDDIPAEDLEKCI